MVEIPERVRAEARQAAYLTGAAGAIFAVLFLISMWLLRSAPHAGESDEVFIEFYSGDDRRRMVLAGLYVLPFSAVSFIWFTAALRQWISRSGRRGSQMIGTVQLMSGLAFITLTLASAGASILPAALAELSEETFDVGVARDFPLYGNALLLVFGVRMAAIFVMTTSNIGRATGFMPRWFSYIGIVIALVLFLSYSLSVWLVVVFPVWVLALGLLIIYLAHRSIETTVLPEATTERIIASGYLEE